MRILAWNLGHQTRERPIRDGFHTAVSALAPDVLVLNEYVHGATREPLIRDLAELGLNHVLVSDRLGANNQVLISSRSRLQVGDLGAPNVTDAAASNFLHVRIDECALEVVGVRVPAYGDAERKTSYWRSLCKVANSVICRPILFIGDLNADPASTRSVGGRFLKELETQGWQVPSPQGPWSYISRSGSTSRIDHAVGSPCIRITEARYVAEVAGIVLAGSDGSAVSDHAALVVEIEAVSDRGLRGLPVDGC